MFSCKPCKICCPNGCCGFCKPPPQVQKQVDTKIHLGQVPKENKVARYGCIDIYPGKKNLQKLLLLGKNTIKKVLDTCFRLSSHPIPQCATLRNPFRPRNQFRAIPGTRSSHNIKGLHAINRVPSIPCNSVSIQFPEFRTGIRSDRID
jgi:hypothetical protein